MVNGKQEPAQLKIEIPANRSVGEVSILLGKPNKIGRYDLLCFEGISLMLNIFRGKAAAPNYRLVPPPSGKLETIIVHSEVSHKYRSSINVCPTSHIGVDFKDPPLYSWSYITKCEIHKRAIRLVSCVAGQAASEPRATTDFSRNWNT